MKILVTGAAGMLGKDLVPVLSAAGHRVDATDIEELDITKVREVRSYVRRTGPDVIINCAAYTLVDKAEEEPAKALTVNGTGARNIALACREYDVVLCQLSTDYIFDGKKKGGYTPLDAPNPLQVYGRTKLEGERSVRELLERYYIVRTSWLYGIYGPNFVKSILRKARTHKALRVVDDQVGSPTWTVTLSTVIEKILAAGQFGIYHVSDRTANGISWYDFAREILRLTESDAAVVPAKTDEVPRPARRPANSLLDLDSIQQLIGDTLPFWKDSLAGYLKIKDAG